MVFSTILFLCFFLAFVICIYYLTPKQGKNLFLLLASLCFYAFGEPKYVLIMLLSIVATFVLGFLIAGKGKPDETLTAPAKGSRIWLTVAVLFHLGLLGTFKYTGFFAQNMSRLIPGFPIPAIALPIGISFYTFQGLSYCIDVYRNPKLLQKKFLNVALYISMFPQLIAGPIVRYSDVRSQLEVRSHSLENFASGALRFVTGLSKKAILANTMGQISDGVMNGDFSVMSASAAWLGAIGYTLQIYYDFSGYSDMAIGLGKIFGFEFPENFDHPYISRSVREFWRRWHMSLSGWFRDYLYIPLGGSRSGNVYLNLLIVFLATGLWHGAAWGFVLWGLWHGFFVITERFVGSKKKEQNGKGNVLLNLLGHFYTMLVVVLGWVLFKLVSLRETLSYIGVMFGKNAGGYHAFDVSYYLSGRNLFLFIIALILCLPVGHSLSGCLKKITGGSQKKEMIGRVCVYYIPALFLLALSFVFIITGSYNPFIYFRF